VADRPLPSAYLFLVGAHAHDRADAADLTQEVFVKVFRGVGNFHGESSLRTWIYRSHCARPQTSGAGGCAQAAGGSDRAGDGGRNSGTPLRLKDMLWIPPNRHLMRQCTARTGNGWSGR